MEQSKPIIRISRSARYSILRVVIPYAFFATLWIFLSDQLLGYLVWDHDLMTRLATVKGMVFVLISGSLLYLLLKAEYARRNRAEQAADESQRRLLEVEQKARIEAEKANQAKDVLLALVSHELRTPLTPIISGVDLLMQDSDQNSREILQTIRQCAMAEARLVSDLLDTTGIASGKLKMSMEQVDVHRIIRQAGASLGPELLARDISLVMDLCEAPPLINADSLRLHQVIWNLLGNAVKFTPQHGTITLRSRIDAARTALIIEVMDNGIGIRPEVINRLFNPFEQADSSSKRRYGGLGLGLYLSRSIMRQHGGDLTVASEGDGKGAVFTATLPMQGQGPKPAAAPPAGQKGLVAQ